jgi:hypothetical protein
VAGPVPPSVTLLGTPGLVPAVPVALPPAAVVVVPIHPPAVPVAPGPLVPPVVVAVAAGAAGAGRPTTGVVARVRRAGPMGPGGSRHPDPWVVVRPGPGPALPGPGRLGPPRPRALGRLRLGRRGGGRGRVEGGPADRGLLLPGRAPLLGHDHAIIGLPRGPGRLPGGPTGRPPARRRTGLRGTGPAARRPHPPWFRRLDLDDLGAPAGRAGPTPGGRTTPPAARWSPPSPPATSQPAPPHRGRRPAMCCGATTREAIPWGIGRRVVTARSIGTLIVTLERFEPVAR